MNALSREKMLLEAVTAANNGFAPGRELARAIARGGAGVTLGDLHFDSLAWMEFCISIELNTGAELTPGHLQQFQTLADIATWVEKWPGS